MLRLRQETTTSRRRAAMLATAIAAAVACGCGSDAAGPAAGGNTGPLYLVSTNVTGPSDDLTGYLALVSSLDESATLDLSRAVEIAGGANAMGIVGESSVYAGLWASPTVQRWDLQQDGTLAPGPVISFAQFGLSDAS